MSHFSVLVKVTPEALKRFDGSIDRAVASMLEPYYEELVVEFKDEEDKIRDEYENLVYKTENGYITQHHPDWIDKPIKEVYPSLDDYAEKWYGYGRDEETGRIGYWHNPNSKWDWYEIGGRWSGELAGKDEDLLDVARLGEIDWDKTNIEDVFSTYAVLDKNGWHSRGDMGWWGISYDESEGIDEWSGKFAERFINGENPETIFVVVDCHI